MGLGPAPESGDCEVSVEGPLARVAQGGCGRSTKLRALRKGGVCRIRRGAQSASKVDVDLAHRKTNDLILQTESRLTRILEDDTREVRAGRAIAALAVLIALASGLGCWWLVASGLPSTPSVTEPGRIGVAVLGSDQPASGLQVVVFFDASRESATSFKIAISDLSGETANEPDDPLTVVVYICGPIREGVQLDQVNGEELPIASLGDSPLVSDSQLGDRADCGYATAKFIGFQALVEGYSPHPLSVRDGAKIVYALPGVTTIVAPEQIAKSMAHPLVGTSTVDVALASTPKDLDLDVAAPQIPPTGHLEWTFPASGSSLPDTYWISGMLSDAQKAAQVRLFLAGALSGIAGAAALWALEEWIKTVSRRARRSRRAERGTRSSRAP